MGYYNRNINKWTPFKMTVDTTNDGSPSTDFVLPFTNTNHVGIDGTFTPKYRCRVDWGDGSEDNITTWNQSETTHNYSSGGTYQISIYGRCDMFKFDNGTGQGGDEKKIISIDQWGGIVWKSFNDAFYGCSNMVGNYTDVPVLERVVETIQMFGGCSLFDGTVGDWDMSKVTKPNHMFNACTVFSGDPAMSGWSTSNFISTANMFSASDFNQPIGDWDTSSLTTCGYMFSNADSFDQNIGDWDMTSVVNPALMFFAADVFNNSGSSSISGWTFSPSCINFQYMFAGTPFNQDISSWDVSNIQLFTYMFLNNTTFEHDLGAWDVGKGTSMLQMFQGAASFSGGAGMSNWVTSACTNMQGMFRGSEFNEDIGSWDTSKVTSMLQMFYAAPFNNGGSPSISGWTTSKVGNFQQMFAGNTPFNQPIDNWVTSAVTTMYGMFQSNSDFNQPIGSWDTSKVTDMRYMFNVCSSFNQDIGNWEVSGVTSTYNMFFNSAFNNGGSPSISGWTTSNLEIMYGMFQTTPFNQPIGQWDTSKVLTMQNTFYLSDYNQDLDGWDMSKVTTTNSMLRNASNFNQDIGMWNMTAVTNMSSMLSSSGIDVDNYNNLLTGWTGWDAVGVSASTVLKSNVSLGAVGLNYSSNTPAAQAHGYLDTGLTWTITDSGGV